MSYDRLQFIIWGDGDVRIRLGSDDISTRYMNPNCCYEDRKAKEPKMEDMFL